MPGARKVKFVLEKEFSHDRLIPEIVTFAGIFCAAEMP